MKRAFFEGLELKSDKTALGLSEFIGQLPFNEQGLIPVITQEAQSKRVLMLAWMNQDALEKTLSTKHVTYWSRSRGELWTKGATSGHTQFLVSMSFDCDGDAILCQVEQRGSACHTGRPDCFYLSVDIGREQVLVRGDAGFCVSNTCARSTKNSLRLVRV